MRAQLGSLDATRHLLTVRFVIYDSPDVKRPEFSKVSQTLVATTDPHLYFETQEDRG